MGALPKRRISSGRRDRRRTHDKLSPIKLVECDTCAELKLPHRVCPNCGHYRGRQIFDVDEI
ncbi:MAG: 50S ribosomal protein L32 [Chloroflexi bacterium]|nr:50S ribosomal protein L32 [Chloroflexota bacterium]